MVFYMSCQKHTRPRCFLSTFGRLDVLSGFSAWRLTCFLSTFDGLDVLSDFSAWLEDHTLSQAGGLDPQAAASSLGAPPPLTVLIQG